MPQIHTAARNAIQATVIVLVALLLASCSILDEWYINNGTDGILQVSLLPDSPGEGAPDIRTGPLLESFGPVVYQQLVQIEEYSKEGEIISFALPPRATTYIGGAVGGFTPFRWLEIVGPESSMRITREDASKYFSVIYEAPDRKMWRWQIDAP